jgi:SAM-dependent methyltransferase
MRPMSYHRGTAGLKRLLKKHLPANFQQWMLLERLGVGRRLIPVRRSFGLGAGQCIDRYYIEKFVGRHARDIAGDVLEFQDNAYTVRYGGMQVTTSEVLDVDSANKQATIIADLTAADEIPSERFDCVIATQVLQYPYDVRAAVHTLFRILKPGGVVLGTVPGISQISRRGMQSWGEHWRFTSLSLQRLFSECFGIDNVEVSPYGNVLATTAFLHGLVSEELDHAALDLHDPDYEMVLMVRAVRPLSLHP